MENKQLYGEIDHPPERFNTNFDFVSHIITNMYYDESKDCIIGSYDVLDTPRGRVLNTLLEYGCNVGISARALGNGKKTPQGEIIDVDTYVFKTFDVVANPGFTNASTNLNESESSSLKDALKSLYESFDDEDRLAVKSLYETFYESNINLDSQEGTEDANLCGDIEKTLDMEFELAYYKDLNEEMSLLNLGEDLTRLVETNEQLETEFLSVKQQLQEEIEYNVSIIEEKKLLQKEKETLQESLETHKKESATYKKLFESVKTKLKCMEDKVALLESEKEDLQNSNMRNLNESYESYKTQLSEKDEIIKQLQESLEETQSELEKSVQENVHIREEMNESLRPQEDPQIRLVSVKNKRKSLNQETRRLYESLNK